jgi:dTDP-4-amino-4,6-dideoxygalactose transaminase
MGSKIYSLKNFGIRSEELIDGVGANAKMDEFRAIMGLCNLRHIDSEIEKRHHVYDLYMERLQSVEGLVLPCWQENVTPNYAYFPVLFDQDVLGIDRDEIYDRLKMRNIYARKYFYPLINDADCYKAVYSSKATPIARKISDSILTLPIYADLTETDVNRICDAVTDIIYEVQYYEKFGNAALGECEQIDISNEFRYLPCAE